MILGRPHNGSTPSPRIICAGGRPYTLTWQWAGTSSPGELAYKWPGTYDWQFIASLPDLGIGQFEWNLPDSLALIQFRVSNPEMALFSDTLLVQQPIFPVLGFDCANEGLLTWPALEGIAQYQLYQMGERYLEPLAETSDTLYLINKNEVPGVFFAVAPVFAGLRPPGLTLNTDFQGLECYFRSVQVEEFLADTLRIKAFLGTTFRLAKAELQRKEGEDFVTLSRQETFAGDVLRFEDTQPRPFRNVYRVRLLDDLGQEFLSNEVSGFYLPGNQFFAYPNPIDQGELLTLLDQEKHIRHINVFNGRGQKVFGYAFPFASTFRELPTDALSPGLYLLQIETAMGQVRQMKLLVQ
ncbi:MAG: T9SS type A sorting domain-containing protein [Microscillaceae bacterium]|nr:T9SS type A sorting domain-containing protein [Microscillaceae bacterium]